MTTKKIKLIREKDDPFGSRWIPRQHKRAKETGGKSFAEQPYRRYLKQKKGRPSKSGAPGRSSNYNSRPVNN